MACGAVSRIDPFFVVFGNSPYKVWHSKYGTCEGPKGYLPNKSCTSQARVQWAGTLVSSSLCGDLPYKVWQFMNGPCEGPLGYLPIKSCTSQAQVQWAGTFVSSSLCGESMDGHLTDSTVGSGLGEGAIPPGAVSESPGPVSVQFSTFGSGSGKGAIPPGAVSELPVPVGFHGSSERVRASAIASQLVLFALVGNPIWMEWCVRASAIARQFLSDPGWAFVVTLFIGVFMVCRSGSYCGCCIASRWARVFLIRTRPRCFRLEPVRSGDMRSLRPWHILITYLAYLWSKPSFGGPNRPLDAF
jgi:hypothetical protein